MKSKSNPSPQDQSDERLVAAVDSAIGVIQDRLASLTADNQDAKYSVSDLVRLLELRNQLQDQRPRNITVRWVSEPIGNSQNQETEND